MQARTLNSPGSCCPLVGKSHSQPEPPLLSTPLKGIPVYEQARIPLHRTQVPSGRSHLLPCSSCAVRTRQHPPFTLAAWVASTHMQIASIGACLMEGPPLYSWLRLQELGDCQCSGNVCQSET